MKFKRLFTHNIPDIYELIHFSAPEAMGDDAAPALEHPGNWSPAAAELLADAASRGTPQIQQIEENTVPSWLWRGSLSRAAENGEVSARMIFDRVAGAAAYRGWKMGLFVAEDDARIFFDETRYALAQRFIAIEPRLLATMGLEWAYGLTKAEAEATGAPHFVDVPNVVIDAVVSGRRDKALLGKWQKIVAARAKNSQTDLRFSDTEAQWESPSETGAAAWLNLIAFRHNDGSVNIEALRHATRLSVLLLDLQSIAPCPLIIGNANLAPLLMALALPYDGEAARATAAAINAIITAEAYATSALLASARGAAPDYAEWREAGMRALRNHRRAAFGERNDYEKISVTPLPLALNACPDLALAAAARDGWDGALELAQKHGLRHQQVTGLSAHPTLTLFMECESAGIAPMHSLAATGSEGEARTLHSSAYEALTRLGYEGKRLEAARDYVAGAASLARSPALGHAALRKHGFTAAVIEKIEAYIPQARDVRHVFTPWVIGVDFCRTKLKISQAKIDDVRFDLLAHLGFKAQDITAANAWCYGHDQFDANLLHKQHGVVFAIAKTLRPEARIRMAAAIQGFVSGETGLTLDLPTGLAAERVEKLLLDAWRGGIKSAAVSFDAAHALHESIKPAQMRKAKRASFVHAKAPALPKRGSSSSRPHLTAQGRPKSRGVTLKN